MIRAELVLVNSLQKIAEQDCLSREGSLVLTATFSPRRSSVLLSAVLARARSTANQIRSASFTDQFHFRCLPPVRDRLPDGERY